MRPLTKQEISNTVAPLSGMAAKILSIFLLAIRGQSFTGRELATMLGVTANTITPAVNQLQFHGFLQHNGKQYGWSLLPEIRQLSLGLPAENNPVGEKLIQESLDDPKTFGSKLLSSSNSIGKENLTTTNYQEGDDDPKIFGSSSAGRPENTAPVESENTVLDDPKDIEVAHWLLHGGIAPGSPKMTALLKLELPAEYVQAHVLEHLYEVQTWERGKVGRKPGTGTLIYRLENDWPAPAMRCEDCLEILPCHCDLVKR